MTDWLDDEDEWVSDLFELLTEARAQIDKKIPRRGNRQTAWILGQSCEFLTRWMRLHGTLDAADKYLKQMRRDMRCTD